MPAVFSPGEAETRPLDPDGIVYTTAQKVADLLGIGPGEAVLVSSNTTLVTNSGVAPDDVASVYVTGSDYRNHGFAVGDTILVYSDADPLGFEAVITAIGTNAGGVQLSFISEGLTVGNYEVADNTYVQNTAAFTNGKTRGMKKSIVEQRIKEVQDRIDNFTHNAWRPYLAVAEYINFDTYKPYRRRYYTDYVGTTPLLFRNVQQILRIELWQGDDYRELASAEARLEITDYTALGSDAIFLCPGGGGFAKLAVGTGSQQWDADFNKVTTAQNLADLINKEDRTSRGAVSFTTATVASGNASPGGTTYTQPGASGNVNINVNDEFLASANSDYGNGKLKITSMQQTKGGETATIALNDETNLTLSQVTTTTVNGGVINGTPGDGSYTITFSDSSSFKEFGIVRAVDTEGGVTIIGYTANSGTVLSGGYLLYGAFTDDETLTWTQHCFKTDIGAQSTGSTTIVDAVTGETTVETQGGVGEQARLGDWWLDHEMGIIYFNNSYPFFEWNAVKATYIYGERYLEKAIEEAATKMVAADLLMSDDRSVLIPEGSQNVDLGSKIQLYRKEAMQILSRYKEVVVFS